MEFVKPEDVETKEVVAGVEHGYITSGENMNFEFAELAPDAVTPEHSHPYEQIDYVLDGELTFVVEGEEVVVRRGECLRLESGEVHSAVNRGDKPVTIVTGYSPPRETEPFGRYAEE